MTTVTFATRVLTLPELVLDGALMLDLRGNPFPTLPEWIVEMPGLQKLDLRWHSLPQIPEWLERLGARGCRVLL